MSYFDDKETREYFSAEVADDYQDEDSEARAFQKFLGRVKYGFKKVFGDSWQDEMATRLADWQGLTLLEYLKQHGSVGYNLGGGGYGVAIDIEFGARIFIAQWWPREN